MCPELVLDELAVGGVPSVGMLAFGADGTLYVARPAMGAVTAIAPARAGGDPGGAREINTFAEGLDLPYGLAYHDGALYVTGNGKVYRLRDTTGDGWADEHITLIDDLPAGAGYWTNGIGVGPDGRLYVSQGASCNACVEADPRRGAVLSYALDGSDMQIVASGLHNPIGLAWHPATGELWVSESSRFIDEDDTIPPDELNRVVPGAHYGWPFCYSDREVDEAVPGASAAFCAATAPPALTFPARSTPAGMAFYRVAGDAASAFAQMQGHLLVATNGSWNRADATGYELLLVRFGDDGAPTGEVERITPYGPEPTWLLSQIDTGFYPERPLDVAVGPEGDIYVSIQEGQVFRFWAR